MSKNRREPLEEECADLLAELEGMTPKERESLDGRGVRWRYEELQDALKSGHFELCPACERLPGGGAVRGYCSACNPSGAIP